MEEDIQNYSPTVMFRGTPCMSQTNPKKIVHNTTYLVQPPYIEVTPFKVQKRLLIFHVLQL